jgi:hypothetical protein
MSVSSAALTMARPAALELSRPGGFFIGYGQEGGSPLIFWSIPARMQAHELIIQGRVV